MRIENWSWERPLSEASLEAGLEPLLARCLFDASRAAALLDRYRTESGLTLEGLCLGGKLAGLAGWRMMQEAVADETITAAGKVELLHLAVAPEFERQGMGTVLLHQVLQKSGAAVLVAETDAEAVAFYRRTGCTIINLGEKYPGKERFRCELRPYASRTAEELDFEVIALWPQSRIEAYYLFPSGSWPLDAEELREQAAIRQFPTVLLDAAGVRAAYANIYESEGLVQPDLEELLAELADGFTGWDFDYLTGSGRMSEAPLPWCYRNLLHPYLKKAASMLDMGTGGGEFLLRLKPLPAQTWATEGYLPNIPVAQKNLKPEGVTVIGVHDDDNLPLPDSSLELIINRHESFSPHEVARLLKPGGIFITQQAGGRNDEDFNHWLGAPLPSYYDWSLESSQKGLSEAGLELLWGDETFVHTRFHDLGAMILYLRIVEWQIENFSVDTYKPQLSELHRRFAAEGWLDVTCHRFVLAARKPNR